MGKKKVKKNDLRSNDILVKFEHLNIGVQNKIVNFYDHPLTHIKGAREHRLKANLALLAAAGLSFSVPEFRSLFGVSLGLIPPATLLGGLVVKINHIELVDLIKKNGLLQTGFEGYYPKDWINPFVVSRTHPSFHVKGNGDIVFHRTTRKEYFRVKFQDKFKVASWRWRACLSSPIAPKKVKDWAKEKLKKISEKARKLKPKPKPLPVPKPAYAKRKKRHFSKLKFA